jgi:hypothetical protein
MNNHNQPKAIIDFQVLHSRVGPWPHLQTLDNAGKAWKGQTF